MSTGNGDPVKNPTWYGEISRMFTQTDIDHMLAIGLDLRTYDTVKASASQIYSQVATGRMPPGAPWSQGQVQTFLNWMTNNYPKGAPPVKSMLAMDSSSASTATRIRKEITELSDAETQLLIKAFEGILAKPTDDPDSYFVQAGYHWLPAPLYCQHHVPRYNPWHRAYLLGFENALRSVPGCESVTLPYWDIKKPFPELLKKAPFASYELPEDIGPGFAKGYVTSRYDYPQIETNLKNFNVADDIDRAMSRTDWEDFHGLFAGATNDTIIMAHDSGHGAIGETMSNQSVAAYDPVFWFFHCNWDRLFWRWQQKMNATTLNGLLSTIDKTNDPLSYNVFTIPALMTLDPFSSAPLNLNTTSIIDSAGSLDVDYQDPTPTTGSQPKLLRMASTADDFQVQTDKVNVRVGGLNRVKIPGSFSVHLTKDGKPLASRFMFQPEEVAKCENCVNNAVVHFDFELPLNEVKDGKLGVKVEPANKDVLGDTFPDKMMGNPTIDVRLMLTTE